MFNAARSVFYSLALGGLTYYHSRKPDSRISSSLVIPAAITGAALGSVPLGRHILSQAIFFYGPLLSQSLSEYRERRREGEGRVAAALTIAAENVPFFALANIPVVGLAFPILYSLGATAFGIKTLVGVQRRTQLIPFAHRWEWSDAATRAMQKVNLSMRGNYYLGNEAALMSQRYMRDY
jgi:hypothetical protein